MHTWIALLRGINVGGHRKLPMKELVAEMEKLGLSRIKTYIQSGNAVFRGDEPDAAGLAERIAGAVEASHGFRPRVLVLSLETLRAAILANPFPAADAEPKTVHLCFLAEPATSPDLDALDAARAANEDYVLAGEVLYLHTPDGIGRSKLAERVERALGVEATARNWRSANKVLELAETIS